MPDPIRKIALSRYAAQLLAAHPELAAQADPARAAFSRAEMEQALHGARSDDETAFKRRLRRLRQRVLLRTMARDLEAGVATVQQLGLTTEPLGVGGRERGVGVCGRRAHGESSSSCRVAAP